MRGAAGAQLKPERIDLSLARGRAALASHGGETRDIRLQRRARMVAAMPDDARWTMMGFADQLGRRIEPGHRRVPRRAALRLALGWAFWLFLVSLAMLIVGLVFTSPAGRQVLRDTAASAGFGTPTADARLLAIRCERTERRGRWAISGERCDVTVSDRGVRRTLDLRVSSVLTPGELRGFVRIGDALALRWPAGVMIERWVQVSPIALGLALLLPLAWYLSADLMDAQRCLATIRSGVPLEVDLLRRVLPRRSTDAGQSWEFAYEINRRRRFGRTRLDAEPLIVDAAATRAVALITPGGAAQLLRCDGHPLAFDADDVQWIHALSFALCDSIRPEAPGLAALAASVSGAERDVVEAFTEAWHAADPETAHAANARRHQAAAKLPLAAIDALLARCRAETRRRPIPAEG
jgi:hypothetical protein